MSKILEYTTKNMNALKKMLIEFGVHVANNSSETDLTDSDNVEALLCKWDDYYSAKSTRGRSTRAKSSVSIKAKSTESIVLNTDFNITLPTDSKPKIAKQSIPQEAYNKLSDENKKLICQWEIVKTSEPSKFCGAAPVGPNGRCNMCKNKKVKTAAKEEINGNVAVESLNDGVSSMKPTKALNRFVKIIRLYETSDPKIYMTMGFMINNVLFEKDGDDNPVAIGIVDVECNGSVTTIDENWKHTMKMIPDKALTELSKYPSVTVDNRSNLNPTTIPIDDI